MLFDSEALTITLSALSPLLVLTLGALVLLLVESSKTGTKLASFVTLLTLLTSIATTVSMGMFDGDGLLEPFKLGGSMIVIDPLAAFFALLIVVSATLAAAIGLPYLEREGISSPVEHQFLLLCATAGGVIMAIAGEFVTLFLGLEILSMSVYCMCGSRRGSRSSVEAAFKYFILGCFSSAFFLYGIAIYYGISGTTVIAPLTSTQAGVPALVLAFAFIMLGTGFKVGLFPFHSWIPDVYQGSPLSVTTFMSAVVKLAAVCVLIRVTGTILSPTLPSAAVGWWLLSILSIVFGNLVALRQRSVRRMLAYSSIAQAGYVLLGVVSFHGESGSLAAALFYLGVYAIVTIGAFGTILVLQYESGSGVKDQDDISQYNGMARKHPVLAAIFALLLLTLAGLPPGLGGLIGKLYIFSAALRGEYVGLAIVAVLGSVVGLYYYLRVILAMYFIPTPTETEMVVRRSIPLTARLALGLCTAGVLLVGIMPTPFYERALAAVNQFSLNSSVVGR